MTRRTDSEVSPTLYRGVTVTLEDYRQGIDTNHAQELRGGKWTMVRRVCATSIRNPALKPFTFQLYAADLIGLLLPGSLDDQLIAAAKWRIDAPAEFIEAQDLGRRLDALRRRQDAREAAGE